MAIVAGVSVDSANLEVEHRPEGLAVTGEIDAHTAQTMRDALVPTPVGSELRVDLSGVTFIDSSGLRVLIEVHQAMQHDGGRLVLSTPSAQVVRVFRVAGLAAILDIDPPLPPAP